jgi:G3E family GTPase
LHTTLRKIARKMASKLATIVVFFLLLFSLCNPLIIPPPKSSAFPPKLPITVISGFLGAGKTSLLQNVLTNAPQSRRVACVVNDVAEVNIDAKLIRGGSGASSPAGLVQLQNGCACCSGSDDLVAGVTSLVTLSDMRAEASEKFTDILIECSGVSNPSNIRSQFQDAADTPLMKRVALDTLVTVVDCTTFLERLRSPGTVEATPELLYRTDAERLAAEKADEDFYGDLPGLKAALDAGKDATPISSLLAAQVEASDVVLLNKIDLAPASVVDNIKRVVAALNPQASVQTCLNGAVNWENILASKGGKGAADKGVVDDHKSAVDHAHSHDHSRDHHLDHSHDHHHDASSPAHGSISTFVYKARRPFHPTRLSSVIASLPTSSATPAPPFNAVLRSKGFCWLSSGHTPAYYWSHAGSHFEMQCLGRWWHTVDKSDWPSDAVDSILEDFCDDDEDGSTIGDRRQEIVFIGENMTEIRKDIARCLDGCLLTDVEYRQYCEDKSDENKLDKKWPVDNKLFKLKYL